MEFPVDTFPVHAQVCQRVPWPPLGAHARAQESFVATRASRSDSGPEESSDAADDTEDEGAEGRAERAAVGVHMLRSASMMSMASMVSMASDASGNASPATPVLQSRGRSQTQRRAAHEGPPRLGWYYERFPNKGHFTHTVGAALVLHKKNKKNLNLINYKP